MHAPTVAQLKDATYILRYLKGTADMGITFRAIPGQLTLSGFTDNNFTTPDSNGKSVSGYVFSMGSGAISYRSRLQSTVAKCIVEAEYVALGLATTEAIFLRMLLTELGHALDSPTSLAKTMRPA